LKENRAGDVVTPYDASSRAAVRLSFVRAAKGRYRLNPNPSKKPEPPKKPEFERSLARLEEIVRKLENTNLSLDEAMKLFEEGVTLSRDCQKQLEQAEGRVEVLMKKAGGEMAAEPFEPGADDES
jgi:exodeoxyribonuclease VII small subunit